VSLHSLGQVVLLPAQLDRLATVFPEGGAVKIFQSGSVVTASNGDKQVILDGQGKILGAAQ
jgi:hypothetical protein